MRRPAIVALVCTTFLMLLGLSAMPQEPCSRTRVHRQPPFGVEFIETKDVYAPPGGWWRRRQKMPAAGADDYRGGRWYFTIDY
jgi:hypothetical protein